MCRSGGETPGTQARRCDCDTSEARRLRRRAAAKRAEYATETVAFVGTKIEPEPVIPTISAETIKARVENLNADKAAFTDLAATRGYPPYEWKGIQYNSWIEATDAARFEMEQETVAIGENVAALADQISGYDDTTIQNHLSEIQPAEELAKIAEYTEIRSNAVKELNEVVPGQTFSEISYALYAYMRNNPEKADDLKAILKRYTDAGGELNKIKAEVSDRMSGRSEFLQTTMKARTDAYREALAQIRPMGGELKTVSPRSDKKKAAVLQSVMENVPTDWVTLSNQAGEFVVKKTAGRAHYVSRKTHSVKEVVPHYKVRIYEKGTITPEEAAAEGMIPLSSDQTWKPEKGTYSYSARFTEGVEEAYVMPDWDYASTYGPKNADGSPKGRGWQPYTYSGKRFDRETGTSTSYTETRYRRQRTMRTEKESYSLPELSVDSQNSVLGGTTANGASTAQHEFSHRIETYNKHITLMERTFVERRTTNPDGERQPLQAYYTRSRERVRPDEFIDKYMGKEYSSDYYEVLSTGSEALFHGDFGAFEGVAQRKTDFEMRNFVLGLFASA